MKKNPPKYLDEAFTTVNQELLTMFIKKYRDYGKGNILANGELGISMRITEKVERIKHLLLSGKAPTNESIDETWIDIAVYAVIGTLYRRNWFQQLEVKSKPTTSRSKANP